MTDDKVVYPEEIEDSALPNQSEASVVSLSSESGGVSTQKTTSDASVPTKRIAVELLSTALNTRTKKILKEFEFTPSGAIQIGEYTNGVSGDIKISPDGIVARNSSGINTLAIDGDTGDAVFSGTIQAGTLVSGQVAVGDDAIQIDGENKRIIFYDADGKVAILLGMGDF